MIEELNHHFCLKLFMGRSPRPVKISLGFFPDRKSEEGNWVRLGSYEEPCALEKCKHLLPSQRLPMGRDAHIRQNEKASRAQNTGSFAYTLCLVAPMMKGRRAGDQVDRAIR